MINGAQILRKLFNLRKSDAIDWKLIIVQFWFSEFFLRKIFLLNNAIYLHIKVTYPEEWQDFSLRGRHMGDEIESVNQKPAKQKWAKHLALEPINAGTLLSLNDPLLSKQVEQKEKYMQLLTASPVFAYMITELISYLSKQM